MAVNVQTADVIVALRLNPATVDEAAQVERLIGFAKKFVDDYARDAPQEIANEAAIRLIGYLYDQPFAPDSAVYRNSLRNSGAGFILDQYKEIGATSIGQTITRTEGDILPPQQPSIVPDPPDTGKFLIESTDGELTWETLNTVLGQELFTVFKGGGIGHVVILKGIDSGEETATLGVLTPENLVIAGLSPQTADVGKVLSLKSISEFEWIDVPTAESVRDVLHLAQENHADLQILDGVFITSGYGEFANWTLDEYNAGFKLAVDRSATAFRAADFGFGSNSFSGTQTDEIGVSVPAGVDINRVRVVATLSGSKFNHPASTEEWHAFTPQGGDTTRDYYFLRAKDGNATTQIVFNAGDSIVMQIRPVKPVINTSRILPKDIGTDGQVLTVESGSAVWKDASGGGGGGGTVDQTARDAAAAAQRTADSAQLIANDADSAANQAKQLANTAINNSRTALSTAETAKTTADAAKTTADGVDAKATAAVTSADQAKAQATAAVNSAASANTKANANAHLITPLQNAVQDIHVGDVVDHNWENVESNGSEGGLTSANQTWNLTNAKSASYSAPSVNGAANESQVARIPVGADARHYRIVISGVGNSVLNTFTRLGADNTYQYYEQAVGLPDAATVTLQISDRVLGHTSYGGLITNPNVVNRLLPSTGIAKDKIVGTNAAGDAPEWIDKPSGGGGAQTWTRIASHTITRTTRAEAISSGIAAFTAFLKKATLPRDLLFRFVRSEVLYHHIIPILKTYGAAERVRFEVPYTDLDGASGIFDIDVTTNRTDNWRIEFIGITGTTPNLPQETYELWTRG